MNLLPKVSRRKRHPLLISLVALLGLVTVFHFLPDPKEDPKEKADAPIETQVSASEPSDAAALLPIGSGPNYPKLERVVARGLSAAPGAIVCPNYEKVAFLFHLYAEHWEEASQDAVTGGESKRIRGDAAPAPDPSAYDCTLVPPGTKMMMQEANGIPSVAVRMSDGTVLKGVTMGEMVSRIPDPDASRSPAAAGAQ